MITGDLTLTQPQRGIIGMSDLKDLFKKHECDKSGKHSYHEVYEPRFEPSRNEEINILEVGTYRGASTRAFHEYFPNANIYTIDTFQRVSPRQVDILRKDRVTWMKADSMSDDLPEKIKSEWGDVEFDFIIDDGAHWPKANHLTLKNLHQFLKDDGIYFIEDVWPLELMSEQELSFYWLRKKKDLYTKKDNDEFLKYLENFNVIRHDRRKKNIRDSYIIELTKK